MIPTLEAQLAQARRQVQELQRTVEHLRTQLVSGFYEDEFPIYTQGPPEMELQGIITAEEVNGLVQRLKDAEKKGRKAV